MNHLSLLHHYRTRLEWLSQSHLTSLVYTALPTHHCQVEFSIIQKQGNQIQHDNEGNEFNN